MENNTTAVRCMLKEYRRRKGLSQDELANAVGVRRQAIYDMEARRYLPNTSVALRLARVLGCTVEMLFVEDACAELGGVHFLYGAETAATRLALAQVRGKVIGIPLQGDQAMSFRLEASDGFLLADKNIDCSLSHAQLDNTLLMLGCDPALNILSGLIARIAPGIRVHTLFASSRKALEAVNEGNAHIAGTHYHHFGSSEGNIEAVQSLSPGMACQVIAFSEQEEGLMVTAGNPLSIRTVEDLANDKVCFVNREEGAALRHLLDTQLLEHGVPSSELNGYTEEVYSHGEGAMRVASGASGAALGLRVVAESFGLDFVPLAATSCDLVIPSDLRIYPGVTVLLDILQSSGIRKELACLSGYDASNTGRIISG